MPGLNSPFSEFYSGSMLAPDRVGNTLQQSHIYGGPTSVDEMYKGIYSDVPKTPAASIPSLYDVNGPGPNFGALTGMLVDPIYGGGSAQAGGNGRSAAQAIEAAAPRVPGYRSDFVKTYTDRLAPTPNYADSFGPKYSAPRTSGVDSIGAGPMWSQILDMFSSPGLDFSAPPNNFHGAPTSVDPWAGQRGVSPAPSVPGLVTGNGASGSIADLYGGPPQPSVPPGSVQIASGKVVPVGTTGTAQDGRYSYTVQADGSIAKTINPTPVATNDSSYFAGSRQAAAQAALTPQSHDFGPGYRPF